MSDELELPSWAARVHEPPLITRYAGPVAESVQWRGEWNRTRFQINVPSGAPKGLELGPGPQALDVSIQQAAAIAAALNAVLFGEPPDPV